MAMTSSTFTSAQLTITVTNLGPDPSEPTSLTIQAAPTQAFSHSMGPGGTGSCTNKPYGSLGTEFTCAVPSTASGGTFTQIFNLTNLSGQGPRYFQVSATTAMPGDTNSANNRAFRNVQLSPTV